MNSRTNHLSRTLVLTIAFFCASGLMAQNSRTIIQDYMDGQLSEMKLQESDISEWTISNEYYSESTDITHVHIKQSLNGLEVVNATANFNLLDGEVFSMGNRLVNGMAQKSNSSSPSISPQEAIERAAEQLGINGIQDLKIIDALSSTSYVFGKAGISLEDIPVDLVYQYTKKDELRLAWDLSINTMDGQNWWSVRVDAETGMIISKDNWTAHCDFDGCAHSDRAKTPAFAPEEMATPPVTGSYVVFEIPTESPAHGPRTLVTDPDDPIASPFGWHDTNGIPGDEFTTTRGNNVHAYEDRQNSNSPGISADGGVNMNFDFPYSGSAPAYSNLGAVTTNLFYMNNIMHDVWYQYGFDEASGNFQTTNYSGAGGFGNDYVRAEAQDGSGLSNANFSTPNDGQLPRMQMYLWTDDPTSSDFSVNSPPSDAGLDINYINSGAAFGPGIPLTPITADLVLVTDDSGDDPYDACEGIVNADELDGKIAVIRRGTCLFVEKIAAAEDEGALAVIIINNVGGDPITMGGDEFIGIPSIMLPSYQGDDIIEALEDGDVVNGTLVNGIANLVAFDSSLDNGIIAHEYGHGISTRLTGGGSNSSCLQNDEQMGEGWSDWFGIMLTMQPGDVSTTNRGVGTYAIGQPNNGTGIRPAPYTTNTNVNSFTYGNTNNSGQTSQPHGIGFVWATMLWDLNWALIDVYGYDPDMYNGTGGNNIAMQLVIDGLKLQSCSPGFVDGRDAILQADELNYGGAHQCLIWETFAARGLGFSASQGSAFSRSDQTQAFDVPPLEVSIDADMTTLTAENDFSEVSFQWIDCSDNSEIAGATEQSFTPDVSGEYAVIAIQNDCSAISDCMEISVAVGIDELIEASVSISPNPAKDFLNIDLGKLENVESIDMMDAQGRTVYSENNISESRIQLDLGSTSAGMYMVRVTTQLGSSLFKVVVE